MPPTQNPVQPEEKQVTTALFTRSQVFGIYLTLGFFILSAAGAALGTTTGGASTPLEFGWFAGVIIGLGTFLTSFVGGLFRASQDKWMMFGSSIIILLGVLIVGFGTCAFNISAANF
jgi:hypothetical protein